MTDKEEKDPMVTASEAFSWYLKVSYRRFCCSFYKKGTPFGSNLEGLISLHSQLDLFHFC
jgi:hypothetical protein